VRLPVEFVSDTAFFQVLVLSGKGGVGKSTVSCQLAWSFAACGLQVTAQLKYIKSQFDAEHVQVGLLDIDICGPSVPHLMGVAASSVQQSPLGWIPVYPVLQQSALDGLSIASSCN
jgi:Mrp family chromosome partitioning ATPase